MKPAAVLDMQADLFARLQTKGFEVFVKGVLRQAVGPTETQVFRQQHTDLVYKMLIEHVRLADAYRVTDEMSMLVQHLAGQLDQSDVLDRTLCPTHWGIVRFDRPLPVKDARGGTMLAHWMTWGPAYSEAKNAFGQDVDKPALVFTWWNDLNDPDGYAQKMIEERPGFDWKSISKTLGRWMLDGAEVAVEGRSLGGVTVDVPPEVQAVMLAAGTTPEKFTNTQRYAHALFLLLNQEIVTTTEDEIPRSAQRRIGRMPIPGRVSVITLRRKAGAEHQGQTMVEWSHRWLVRGHPAWRHCSQDKFGAQPYEKGWRVRVYISPYVKGPEDAPFVQTTKLYNLSR